MKRGDVVLANLPFIGASGSKVRPALIVQEDTLNRAIRETIIVEITSNLAHVSQPHQVLIDSRPLMGRPPGCSQTPPFVAIGRTSSLKRTCKESSVRFHRPSCNRSTRL